MKKYFKLSDGRNVSIETGEMMTNLITVNVGDELIPANLFVETYQTTSCEDDVISQSVFFHALDEIPEELDNFDLSYDDIAKITGEIVSMGDFVISIIAEMAA